MGEGEEHRHGETLGDGHNQHNDGDGDVRNELVHEDGSAYLLVCCSLNQKHGDGGAKDDEGGDEADEFQTAADVVQLVGELRLIL